LGVSEEQLESRAQVVVSGISVARKREAIFGTASITERPDRTTLALGSKRVALVIAEFALHGGGYELHEMSVVNVAQLITRLDEMIAGVDVAVVFQRGTVSASRGVDA
jgi:hypothetical protein